MAKRGALNKVEKFYIEGNQHLSIEEIAGELDRSTAIIKKHLATLSTEQPEPEQPAQPTKNPETRFLQQMGRHERAGQKVATVMTRGASEESDRTRPQRLNSKKIQEAIHKPRS